jgi:flagellar operon protein
MRPDRIGQTGQTPGVESPSAPLKTGSPAFGDALRQAVAPASTGDINISKHAEQRLAQRGIRLEGDLKQRLLDGVDRAAAKGSRTTLVLVDSTAFVVGVPNRALITVADQDNLREKVFTNIDSMVIA